MRPRLPVRAEGSVLDASCPLEPKRTHAPSQYRRPVVGSPHRREVRGAPEGARSPALVDRIPILYRMPRARVPPLPPRLLVVLMSAATSEPLVPLHANQPAQRPSKPRNGSGIESRSPAAHKRWALTSPLLAAQIRLLCWNSVWTNQPPHRRIRHAAVGAHTVGNCRGFQKRNLPRDPDVARNLLATPPRYPGERPPLLLASKPLPVSGLQPDGEDQGRYAGVDHWT